MNWQRAIKLSPEKKASRFEDIGRGFKRVTIKYPDGSGYVTIIHNNRPELNATGRSATSKEIDGFTDWEPSI